MLCTLQFDCSLFQKVQRESEIVLNSDPYKYKQTVQHKTKEALPSNAHFAWQAYPLCQYQCTGPTCPDNRALNSHQPDVIMFLGNLKKTWLLMKEKEFVKIFKWDIQHKFANRSWKTICNSFAVLKQRMVLKFIKLICKWASQSKPVYKLRININNLILLLQNSDYSNDWNSTLNNT